MSYAEREASRSLGSPIQLYLFQGSDPSAGTIGPYGYTDAENSVSRGGITYTPWPIDRTSIQVSGDLDNINLTVRMAKGTPLDDMLLLWPESQVINLTVFEGHDGDSPTNLLDWPAVWSGRVLSGSDNEHELEIACEPLITSLRRPGLRRHWQRNCPHALYGPQCQANKAAATQARPAASVSGTSITLASALGAVPAREKYAGGVLEWTAPNGTKNVRSIVEVSADGLVVRIRGRIKPGALPVGTSIRCSLGCGRITADCSGLHNNILNYGGMPWIPDENPLGARNNFY